MTSKHLLTFICTAGLLFIITACSGDDIKEVSLYGRGRSTPVESKTKADHPPLKVAVAAMISPKETFFYYRELLDLAGEHLNRQVKLIQRQTYEEINDLLRDGKLDMAFICSGAYVAAHDRFGLEILAVPQVNGRSVYFSYFIVPKTSTIEKITDLKGKKFAFTDPLSNTGKISPTYVLAQKGLSPETFFSKTIYTYSHDNSITAVAEKQVDGAAVDSLVWDYLNRTKPELIGKTRIIAVSEPYGIPPVVTGPGTDPALRERLRQFLLHVHETEQGRQVLANIMIDRFVPGTDEMYDSIRRIRKWTNDQSRNPD